MKKNEDEKYAELCDLFWRLLHPTPDDGILHTSSESRALARQVFEILEIWDK